MGYPLTPEVWLPLLGYRVNSYQFREDCTYDGVHWGLHLGEDVNRRAGTPVFAIGRGRVVYSELHPGKPDHGNWGHIIIIAHVRPRTGRPFFSLYAHLGQRCTHSGDRVDLSQLIGFVGRASTPENGFWEDEHLHFAIYVGPWEGRVLTGYWKRGSKRTKLSYWREPTRFVGSYRG